MARKHNESRTNFIVGAFVVSLGAIMLVSLFVLATSEGLLVEKSQVKADFRTIAGLSDSSKVQLAGHEIGKVIGFDFADKRYECYPDLEDLGRDGQGRTDDCEPTLFCARTSATGGLCAELESYAGDVVHYEPCVNNDSCSQGKVCITKRFRDRYRRVLWNGVDGICVVYKTEHRRISVSMEINTDKMAFIRTDSRATIQSNGVLGDKLINISVGRMEVVPDGGRIQTNPSLMEELEGFKAQLQSITARVDNSVAGVEGLFDALNDDRTKRDLKGLLRNANEISRQIKDGDGLIGALFNDENYRAEFSRVLRSLRSATTELESVSKSVRREVPPLMQSTTRAARGASDLLEEIQREGNESLVARLFHDDRLAADVHETVTRANAAIISAQSTIGEVQTLVGHVNDDVVHGRGTLGKLLKDPKAYDDLVKLLGNIERMNVVKKLVRFVIEKEEAASSARPERRP